MLKLELNVYQPWLHTSRIAQDILLVNRVFLGLLLESAFGFPVSVS